MLSCGLWMVSNEAQHSVRMCSLPASWCLQYALCNPLHRLFQEFQQYFSVSILNVISLKILWTIVRGFPLSHRLWTARSSPTYLTEISGGIFSSTVFSIGCVTVSEMNPDVNEPIHVLFICSCASSCHLICPCRHDFSCFQNFPKSCSRSCFRVTLLVRSMKVLWSQMESSILLTLWWRFLCFLRTVEHCDVMASCSPTAFCLNFS